MNKTIKDKILSKLGCGHFNPPRWLAIKLGFDGLCLGFGMPCIIGWIQPHSKNLRGKENEP